MDIIPPSAGVGGHTTGAVKVTEGFPSPPLLLRLTVTDGLPTLFLTRIGLANIC